EAERIESNAARRSEHEARAARGERLVRRRCALREAHRARLHLHARVLSDRELRTELAATAPTELARLRGRHGMCGPSPALDANFLGARCAGQRQDGHDATRRLHDQPRRSTSWPTMRTN